MREIFGLRKKRWRVLGIKYPQPKSSAESPPGGLRPDSYGSRALPTTPTPRGTPPGLLREPGFVLNFNNSERSSSGLLRELDSADNINHKWASPGLLRELGPVLDFNHWQARSGLLREPDFALNPDRR